MSASTDSGVQQPKVKWLHGLTGFRFPIALGIFFIHSSHAVNPIDYEKPVSFFADRGFAEGLSNFLIPIGLPFLSLFFMLSGFVLTWSARPTDTARSFWRRRFFRVFPNHVVTFVVALFLIAGATTNWLPNLLLVNTWDVHEPEGGTNYIVWSLCAELLFYASFPLVLKVVRRIKDTHLWGWAAGMAGGILGINLVTVLFIGGFVYPGNLLQLSAEQMWFASLFPPARIFEFVLGVLLARIVMAGKFPRLNFLTVFLTWIASCAAAQYVPAPWTYAAVALIPNVMMLGAVATADIRGSKNVLTSKFMVWGGNISYAFFMVQTLLVYWLRSEFSTTYSPAVAVLMWVGLLGVCLLAAHLLFTYVEDPIMRRFGRPRKKIQSDPTQSVTPVSAPA